MKNIDIILSTYNWPEALERTLYGFTLQSLKDFRIIIADDGSNEATRALIKKFAQQSDLEIIHCWQEDKGFRKARIDLMALSKAGSKNKPNSVPMSLS